MSDYQAERAMREHGLEGYKVRRNHLDRIEIPFGMWNGIPTVGPVTVNRMIEVVKPADHIVLNLSMMSAGEMEPPGE